MVSFVQNLPQLLTHTDIFSPIFSLCILLLEERCVRCKHHGAAAKVPTYLAGRWESGGLLLNPVQAHHLPSAPGCSTEPGDQRGWGSHWQSLQRPELRHVWGQLCLSHPDKTRTFALVWFVVLSRISPPGLFPLPVVGSCQAVAVFVRGQKQRMWTSDMGRGLGVMGGRGRAGVSPTGGNVTS